MSTIPPGGLHTIATLVKRLEASACRLEDIADVFDSKITEHSRRPNSYTDGAAIASSRPTTTTTTTTSTSTAAISPASPSTLPPPASVPAFVEAENTKFVLAYKEDVIEKKLKLFLDFTREFAGPNVIEMAALVEKEYYILLDFLKVVAACQKPKQDTLEILIKDFPVAIEAINRAKESMRRDREWYTHLTFLCEGSPVIAWVVNPKPATYITESVLESMTYYGNKLKKEYKDKDPKHTEWVNHCISLVEAMKAYAKEYHPTGASWNAKGITTEQYQAAVAAAQSAPPGAPLPPPPPPPPPPPDSTNATSTPASGAAAVFAELNRGDEVTKGLRKVDKSEMTHKNPSLRASSVVPAPTSPVVGKKPAKPSKPQALSGKKPPKFLLNGSKWLIEYHEHETLTLEDVSLTQSVNIFGCKGATILIKGKVNAVNMLNCQKTSILVHNVVASVSVTNSPSFTLQITGTAPMVQVDTTDSGQIYLSRESLTTEITTAKCSAINISLPVEGEEEGVFEEQPVPEMFRTVVKDGKLVTMIVEHSG